MGEASTTRAPDSCASPAATAETTKTLNAEPSYADADALPGRSRAPPRRPVLCRRPATPIRCPATPIRCPADPVPCDVDPMLYPGGPGSFTNDISAHRMQSSLATTVLPWPAHCIQ